MHPEAPEYGWAPGNLNGANPEHPIDTRTILHVYLQGTLDPPDRGARLAAWINAYNRLVADGIAALGIRQSVWEVPDFFDRICLRTGELVFSANDIEHGVLRGNRPNPPSGAAPFVDRDPRRPYCILPLEARIHFAINCGVRSCPPVRLYRPETFEEELEAATRSFVNREVALEGGLICASPIFKMVSRRLRRPSRRLCGFLARYLTDEAVALV